MTVNILKKWVNFANEIIPNKYALSDDDFVAICNYFSNSDSDEYWMKTEKIKEIKTLYLYGFIRGLLAQKDNELL